MAKCRMLIQENQELGRQLSQGRIAQLEAELALQKKYSEELKSSQDGERNLFPVSLVKNEFYIVHGLYKIVLCPCCYVFGLFIQDSWTIFQEQVVQFNVCRI